MDRFVHDSKDQLSAVYYRLSELDFQGSALKDGISNVTLSGWNTISAENNDASKSRSVTCSAPCVTRLHFHEHMAHVPSHNPGQQCFYVVVAGSFSLQANNDKQVFLMNPGDVLYAQPSSVIQQICALNGPQESLIYVISKAKFEPSFDLSEREIENASAVSVWRHKIDGTRYWTDNSGDFPVKVASNWVNFFKKKYNMANRVQWPAFGQLGAHHHPSGAIYIALEGRLFYGGDFPNNKVGTVEQYELRWVRPGRFYGPESTDQNGALFLALHPGYLETDQWMQFQPEEGEHNDFIPQKKGFWW
eukprot:TRINITY_DN1347_c0_g1_i1.p1 TRINITY_DN1347_c0_g1~~TRINITY_DN1347_c0_g1_i1.p1  ORF type:complete len:304 (-),score=86.82 TRINITY_DN1347_c0_g1_i1:744-1655(-)